MMDEDWGEDSALQVQNTYSQCDEGGRSYGKGRGFIIQNNNVDGWGSGNKDFHPEGGNGDGFKTDRNTDAENVWGDNSNNFSNGRSGRGGGRGGANGGGRNDRGGRGGGGRGGYRSYQNNENYEENNEYGYGNDDNDDDNDGFKPSTRGKGGSFKSRNNDSDDNFDANSGFESRGDYGGGRVHRGRGGGRGENRNRGGRDNYGESNSYKRSGGYGHDNDDDSFHNDRGNRSERGGRGERGDRGGGRGRRGVPGGQTDSGDTEEFEKPREIYIPPELCDEKSLFENGVAVGINFDKYDNIEVKVSGENPPQTIEQFETAGLRNIVLENIKKSGYTKPTPVQKYALPIIMEGRDLMACAQTGSGKTAAFAVPIVNTLLEKPTELIVTSDHCEPQVVIVSPTRELTIQIWQQIMKFSINSILKTVVAYGGTSVLHQRTKLSAGCHILVATPGRLLDFLDKGRITFSSVRFLILDEADRMLDMGFLPSIERIVDHETMVPLGERQTLMFSATFPDEVQRLAARFLHNYLFLAVGIVGGACSDVEQSFYEVTKNKKKGLLKEILEREKDAGTLDGTLVFVEMKRKADFIAAFLSENSYPTTSIHGDRLQRQREEALADFKSGRMSVLVATAVAARGLDIKNVAHVINYDLPKGIDEYVHRIGRTGRVGNRGRATSFFDPDDDTPLRGDLVRILKQADQPVPDWLLGGGSSSRSFAPGRGNRFGGEDVRGFDEGGGETYTEEAYTSSVPVEPEESW